MYYSVKVNFGQNLSIEVFGDEIEIVTQLLDETTRKFFLISTVEYEFSNNSSL